nr:unnamed protein product [Spirometra erinaceieuropaei]
MCYNAEIITTKYRGKARRIVEYDSLNIPLQLVRTGVVIYLTPNPSCVEQKTCRDCLHQDLKNFVCQWCAQTLTCSSGVDRDWQRWHEMKCHLSAARTHCGKSATD